MRHWSCVHEENRPDISAGSRKYSKRWKPCLVGSKNMVLILPDLSHYRCFLLCLKNGLHPLASSLSSFQGRGLQINPNSANVGVSAAKPGYNGMEIRALSIPYVPASGKPRCLRVLFEGSRTKNRANFRPRPYFLLISPRNRPEIT